MHVVFYVSSISKVYAPLMHLYEFTKLCKNKYDDTS